MIAPLQHPHEPRGFHTDPGYRLEAWLDSDRPHPVDAFDSYGCWIWTDGEHGWTLLPWHRVTTLQSLKLEVAP